MRYKADGGAVGRLVAKCKEHFLRVTPQRIAVYEELYRSDLHPTAEQVHSLVRRRFPSVSLDTVNRTLLTFAEIGLVDIIESFGGPRRFDPISESHHHFHCVKCGVIIDFRSRQCDVVKIPSSVVERHRVIGKRVVLNGVCERCLRKNRRDTR